MQQRRELEMAERKKPSWAHQIKWGVRPDCKKFPHEKLCRWAALWALANPPSDLTEGLALV